MARNPSRLKKLASALSESCGSLTNIAVPSIQETPQDPGPGSEGLGGWMA